jgi:hypothetical protein
MTRLGIALTVGLIATAGVRGGAAGAAVDDDFVITGCVTDATAPNVVTPSNFFWTRGDIMLAAAEARPDAVPMTGRVFYWLDDHDQEHLAKYQGQRVEIKGDLKDLEKGKVKIDRDDGFVKVKLDLDGKDQEARVPADWVSSWKSDKDQKYDIAVRRIDIDKVKVLGPCGS